ncbi:TetR/AcrR family transcriptional regulator [Clostridium folliculivorans]|uniref:Transcriptional regulator n=1 Tax=Clostridium folliculivorans TaxID=2886038 RepID=A0A9W5Y5X4_9CLOT|nr:TetR/AcrR family transcriptional regulator [Clostridium folliculivorans]GKU27339.1 transcriptional regulator [Clostridium folliculivorans]GKU32190.1 transcriptional regulator [Clostridium folliculivorans]
MPKILLNIKDKLIEEGRSVLTNSGYNNFNIRDIAKSCNIGIGTFYNYFSNKDALIIEIITNDWDRVIELSNSLIYKDIHIKDKLFLIYSDINKFLSTYIDTFMMMTVDGSKGCPHQYIFDQIYEALEQSINIATEKGEIRPLINSKKLAKFIINSMTFAVKQKDISFDEIYHSIQM